MPSAKPDKPLFAATDLLTDLPEGVRFRQAEVWAGLDGALQRRKRRALTVRWSVAAALLLALATGWWLRPATGADGGKQVAHKEQRHTQPMAASAQTKETPVASAAATTPVEIRKTRHDAQSVSVDTATITTVSQEPVLIAQATVPASIDTPKNVAVPASVTPAAPARRFRVGHINDNAPPEPVLIADAPVEERGSNGLIHIPLTGVAGPNAGTVETYTERKPRTLMSLFKSHQ